MLNLKETHTSTISGWKCPKCAHQNTEAADMFCGGCGSSREQANEPIDPPIETTSTIALILVILFLSLIGLIALLLFGGTAASVAGNVYAELSKTPYPVPSLSPTPAVDSHIPYTPRSYTIPTPTPDTSYAVPSTVDVPDLSIPEVSAYPTPLTPITSSSRATVISENANLRADPVATGEVISVVPQGSAVEIIRQKGPWFFVSVGAETGWLHGNTIELKFDQ